MKRYNTTKKSMIVTDNQVIKHDGYASIEIVNIGDVEAIIDDNTPLLPDNSFSWINEPYVTINQDTNIRFKAGAGTKKIFVQLFYFEEK